MRPVTAILRDLDTIAKSKHMTLPQKAVATKQLQHELDLATQPELPGITEDARATPPNAPGKAQKS